MSGVCIGCVALGYPSAATAAAAAAAVAAMVDFRAYGHDEYFAQTEFTTATLERYHLVTTPVLEAGVYSVTVGAVVTGTAAGTDIDAMVLYDGAPTGVLMVEANRVEGGFLFSITTAQVWADGVHTIEYKIANAASPGEAWGRQATTTWVRES